MPRQQSGILYFLFAAAKVTSNFIFIFILTPRETGSFDNCDAAVVVSFGGERLRMRGEGGRVDCKRGGGGGEERVR